MSFHDALDAWGKEAKGEISNQDRMRAWIKYAARVQDREDHRTQEFTSKVEKEVFDAHV